MHLGTKLWKKAVSLGLALNMAAALFVWQAPLNVNAADRAVSDRANEALEEEQGITLEAVRNEAAESYAGSEKTGFDIDFDQDFSGSGLDYSTDTADRHYMEVLNNLKNSEADQTVIIRFKTTNPDGLLFGAGTNTLGNGKNMVFGLQGGAIRCHLRNVGQDGAPVTGVKGNFGSGYADGKYHTLAVSFLPSIGLQAGNVRFVVDGGPNLYSKSWTELYKVGMNQNQDDYTKFEIAGGSYVSSDTSGGASFNGEIDFLTVINKAYSVEQLQKITMADRDFTNFSVMWTGGTCHTWLFTGGTEGVADFATGGTTRNWVGMFEDSMRASGSYVERGRFVFNTSKRNADVKQILNEYDTRVAPFGTYAVGIMIGEADYGKGQDGIEEFKENLQAFLDKVIDDNKLPFILTPYPSGKNEDKQNITGYTEAIQEVAGTRIKVVDLRGLAENYIKPDGSLTASGHQAVANLIKDAVGTNSKTNYAFNQLSDGSYTVAKQTEAKELAQVAEVTAGEGGIKVKAEEDPADSVQLEYTLEDESGIKISASAEENEFTVDGLKKGEKYILNVYDVSRGNVRESYQPVEVTVIAGNKGINCEYENQNSDGNEKIQELFTREEPTTYLFMGDSITHGIVTQGYDNVPQMFAKYLDEIGRTDDIVLNTGVSNATIATTLDQIEPRLMRYNPDVVMIMLGTNDSSSRGENVVSNGSPSMKKITADEYKERYRVLVEKVFENNPKTSIVLRVPCEMIVDNDHKGYEDLFDAIYEVADEERAEHPDLNIIVVNHRQEWLDYQNNVRNDNVSRTGTYGWLVDLVHPNGRGNLSMVQQIVRELGIYVNTSELANYQYALNDWSDTSAIEVPVTQRGSRAGIAMSGLSGYTNKLKNVTLTLTADGKSISKTEEYTEDGEITLSGLDLEKEYTAAVTGKDAVNSKIITFQTNLTVSTDTELTEKEEKEFTDSLEEAKVSGEASSYPAEVLAAYETALSDIKLKYENALTTENLDAALAEIKVAKENFAAALDTAKSEAVRNLADALAASEKTYQEQKNLYDTLPGWNAYQTAYQNAKAADGDADTNTLRKLLKALNDAEQTIIAEKLKKEEEEKKDNSGGTQPVPEEKAEEGKVYTEGDYSYKILSLTQKTVEITGIADGRTLKKITVGDDVTIKGEAYKIVSVGNKAFSGNKNAAGAVIGKNVETIGAQAFAKCTKLKSVTINSKKLNEIGSKAFFNSKKINKIIIKSTALKKAGKNAFKGTAAKLKIKVPKAKLKKYKSILAKKGQGKKAVITK